MTLAVEPDVKQQINLNLKVPQPILMVNTIYLSLSSYDKTYCSMKMEVSDLVPREAMSDHSSKSNQGLV